MNTPTPCKPIDILLVEDSPTDTLLTKRALANARLINRLHMVEDGVKAMAFLRREDRMQTRPARSSFCWI